MKAPFLIGQAIYLRPLEREDAPLIVPWLNDPEVTHTLAMYHPLTLRAEEEFIDNAYRKPDGFPLGIVRKDGDQLIGVTGLEHMDFKNLHTSFGLFIGEKHLWGRGHGTEATALMVGHAIDTLNFNRVWLMVYEYNTRGIRSYEKIGFRQEGILRQHRYHQGRYWNTILMAILREEWNARKPR